MPMPPAFANDLPYSSLRNERHTPALPAPPNGPSPSMPVSIWLNIELRNIASKSVAWPRALRSAGSLPAVAASAAAPAGGTDGGIADILHHLDLGLDRARRLDRLQDRDHVERPDAERIEAVDQLLQRHALLHHRELPGVLLDADTGARNDDGAAARERRRLADLRGLGHGDREVALGDGDGRHPHVAPDHDHARALVDDDLGGKVGIDLQLLDLGQQRDHVAR